MINEFVQVTDNSSEEKYLINLSDISFIREMKSENNDDYSVIKLKSKDKMVLQVKESFESFEEFFENLGEE